MDLITIIAFAIAIINTAIIADCTERIIKLKQTVKDLKNKQNQ